MLGDCIAQLLDWTPGVFPAKKIAGVYFSKRNYRKLGGTNFESPKFLEAPADGVTLLDISKSNLAE
jgi:hypothetical protein